MPVYTRYVIVLIDRIDPASRFKMTGFIFYFVLRPTLTLGRLLLRYSLIAFQYAINHSCNKRSRNHRRKLFSEQFTTRSWNEKILLVVMGQYFLLRWLALWQRMSQSALLQ